MLKRMLSMILALTMAAAIVGCAPGSNNDPSMDPDITDGAPTPTEINLEDSQIKDTDTGLIEGDWVSKVYDDGAEPQYGGDLIYGVNGIMNNYLPVSQTGLSVGIFVAPALEPLARQGRDGEWYGVLAEDWTIDPENATLTIKLREGIKFTDGTDLNAEVAKFVFDLYYDFGCQNTICSPTEVTVEDEYTVVMHFEEYNNSWEENIFCARMFSQKAYEENGPDWCKVNCVGTGPFIQDEYKQGTSCKWVRNENYWQEGLPFLDSITFVTMSDDATKLSSIVNGDCHMVEFSAGTYVQRMESETGVKDITSGITGTINLAILDTIDSEFADVKVRQAAMYALDRDSMAIALTENNGYGTCQPAVPGMYSYLEDPEYPYEYDPEKAKELLTEAGYPDGFSFTLSTSSRNERIAVSIQSYFKAVGIDIDIKMVDSNSEQEMGQTGDIDRMWLGGATFSSVSPISWLKRNWGEDRTRNRNCTYVDPVFQNFLDVEPTLSDKDERIAKLQELGAWMNENLPFLPLYISSTHTYTSSDLYNTNYTTSGGAMLWSPECAFFA